MSKFLKVIVNLFLILAILTAAAILVPPLVGITTTIVDTESMETNLPMGSITYSRDINVTKLVSGDEVLKEFNSKTYAYVIEEGDASTGKFKVLNATDKSATAEEITLRNNVSKVIFTVPYIGYVVVAMHSMEGIIIIGLVVLFMIILFILSELWKKRPEDEEEEEEEEEESEEEKEPARTEPVQAEPVQNTPVEEKTAAPDMETSAEPVAPAQSQLPAGGTTNIYPDISTLLQQETSGRDYSSDELSEEIKKSLSSGTPVNNIEETDSENDTDSAVTEEAAEETETFSKEEPAEPPVETEEKADAAETDMTEADTIASGTPKTDAAEAGTPETELQAAAGEMIPEEPAAAAGQDDDGAEPPTEEEPEPEPEMIPDDPDSFIPVERKTLDELLDEAKQQGEEAKVLKDETTGVSLVDFSDLL